MYRFLIHKINGFYSRYLNLRYLNFFRRTGIIFMGKIYVRGSNGYRKFGEGIKIYPNCVFECFSTTGSLSIGNDCYLSYGVIIACNYNIKIGNNVWVGEYTSIRDTTHNFSTLQNLGSQKDIHGEIVIGNNVWIGRGSIILPGSIIGDNVVIGANSVVKGKVSSNSLYVGAPAQLKKMLVS